MTDITTARGLAGVDFNDMADSEVSGTLAQTERILGRHLKLGESHFFQSALAARRTYLAKKAGIEQPKFDAAMYGTPPRSAQDIANDCNEQGEG